MSTDNIKYLWSRRSGDIMELCFKIQKRIADHIRKNTNLPEGILESGLNKDNIFVYRIRSAGFEEIMKSVTRTIETISNKGDAESFCNHLLIDAGKRKSPRAFHDQMKNEYGLLDENLEWWVAHFFIGLSELLFCSCVSDDD